MKKIPLRVLLVEDNPMDAELVIRELCRAGFEPDWHRVDTEAEYIKRLHPGLDIVISDHELPQFSGPRALDLLLERGFNIPFIIVSGTIGEEVAVESIKRGAADYLLKDRLTRMGSAVEHALGQTRLRVEREKVRQELMESDERFRQVVENIGEVFWMTNLDGSETLYISPGYEKVWGRTCQSLKEDPTSWEHAIHPEDRVRAVAAARSKTEGFDEEYRIVRPDGTVRTIRDRAFPVRNANGEIYRVAGLAEDITASKRADERIAQQAAMLDLAHDAIIVRDFDSEQIIFWNKGAERMYGWTAEEALEQTIGEFICMDPSTPARLSQSLLEKGEWHGEMQHISKTGKKLIVDTRATLIRDHNGKPQAVLSINADVTEQRKLEAQFLRAQRMESIGTLASGVAHDLNNILAPIMMSCELLRHDIAPESRQEIISTIAMSAERGAQIVRQVLAFGRGLEGERRPLSAKASIKELAKILTETLPKGIRLDVEISPELWPIVGDSTQIHQVLLNLCVNARDAMPEGGRMRIAARNVEIDANYASMLTEITPGSYVLIEVADTGTGIPPEIIDRIFDPFFTTKGVGKGTGLGLSTVLGIVKSHGGGIQVTSEPGKGTTFNVYLPSAMDGTEVPTEKEASAVPRGNGELILVVDDEACIRNAAKFVLQDAGYKVLCAADGTEALAAFATHAGQVGAVVTDIAMPYMDGIALIRALRKMQPGIAIAASTGIGEKNKIADLKAVDVPHVLHKPYGADAILRVIREILPQTPQDSIIPTSS